MRNSILFSLIMIAGLLTANEASAQDTKACADKAKEVACVKVEAKCASGEEASTEAFAPKVLLASMPGVPTAAPNAENQPKCQPANCKPANCQPANCKPADCKPAQCLPANGETKTASNTELADTRLAEAVAPKKED